MEVSHEQNYRASLGPGCKIQAGLTPGSVYMKSCSTLFKALLHRSAQLTLFLHGESSHAHPGVPCTHKRHVTAASGETVRTFMLEGLWIQMPTSFRYTQIHIQQPQHQTAMSNARHRRDCACSLHHILYKDGPEPSGDHALPRESYTSEGIIPSRHTH